MSPLRAPYMPGADEGRQGPFVVAMFTYRYSYRPAVWERLLTRAGFATADARVLDAPHPGHIGTLLVRAVAP